MRAASARPEKPNENKWGERQVQVAEGDLTGWGSLQPFRVEALPRSRNHLKAKKGPAPSGVFWPSIAV